MEFNLVEKFGDELSDVDAAQEKHFPTIDNWLKNRNYKGPIAYFNANGIKYIGYSYAKQTFRKVLSNLIDNKYKIYSISFIYDDEDYEKNFDGLIYALNQREYSTFLLRKSARYPNIIGYLSTTDPRESKKEVSKKKHQKAVLDYIIKKKEVFTNDVADELELKLPHTNRILKELEEKRLIKREKETSPSGGPIYMNKSIFTI